MIPLRNQSSKNGDVIEITICHLMRSANFCCRSTPGDLGLPFREVIYGENLIGTGIKFSGRLKPFPAAGRVLFLYNFY